MTENKMKIYTKQGDNGTTSLLGGSIVAKSDVRVEAYGTLDELNCFVGLVRDFAIDTETKNVLENIQKHIFIAEAVLAADSNHSLTPLPKLTENDIVFLEKEIDRMSEHLPALQNFIIPGGHPVVSYCHIVRAVCRRAERAIVEVKSDKKEVLMVLKYINRLSDYFFVLARFIAKELCVEEQIWNPENS